MDENNIASVPEESAAPEAVSVTDGPGPEQPAAEPKKKKKNKRWKLRIILWIFLLLLFIVAGYAARISLPKFIVHERTIEVDSLAVELRSIRELATLEYDYRDTIFKDKANIIDRLYLITYDGRIKSGVDLEKMSLAVIPAEEKGAAPTVRVGLPAAEILSHEVLNGQTLYEEGYSTLSLGDERSAAITEKKAAKEKQFIEAGNLEKARAKSEEVIAEFIKNLYGDDVPVEFYDTEGVTS